MECIHCRSKIPFTANICAYCHQPTNEQRKHIIKYFISLVVVLVFTYGIVKLFSVEAFSTPGIILYLSGFGVAQLFFKFILKGEFTKTGWH